MFMQKHQGGFIEGLIMAFGLAAIFILFILPKGPAGPTVSLLNLSGVNSGASFMPSSGSGSDKNILKDSPQANSVSINTGNASYSIQPIDEYVELRNNTNKPVNISGWKLTNAKGERTYTAGNVVQRFNSDEVVIPRAAKVMSPYGMGYPADVILSPNESAIITTGSIGITSPMKIVSFKENLCTGYIEDLPEYAFTPSLSRNCVQPRYEPGVRNLDTQCQDYINSMQSCRTPLFNTVDTQGRTADRQGNTCNGCVDGNNTLTASCITFIKSHFSYQGCLANHQNDPNFEGRTWRIFLNKQWELWAKNYETISLFDSSGKLVNFVSY
jgi:hypothetical protein